MAALVAGLLLADAGAAQTDPVSATPSEIVVAAYEQHLWLARAGAQSIVFHRGASDPFDRGTTFNGRVHLIGAAGADALVFFDDGVVYRMSGRDRQPEPERALPGRHLPLALTHASGITYALVLSGATTGLPRLRPPRAAAPADAPATQPFSAGDAALSVVAFDGRAWTGLAACPATVTSGGALRPRLAVIRGSVWLFWGAPEGNAIQFARFDAPSGVWTDSGTLGVADAERFDVVTINLVPTLVVARRTAGGEIGVSAFRWLVEPQGGAGAQWRPARVVFNELPAAATPARFAEFFGFNQHLGALVFDARGAAHLVFGRFGEPPAEPIVDPAEVFRKPELTQGIQGFVRLVTLVLLVGLFTGLFVFRRGAMMKVITLPAGWETAFTFQRMAALAIDLLPFSFAAAYVMEVSWAESFRRLGQWALSADVADLGGSEREALLWWGLSAGGYTLYALVMELVARRTVGKLLVGIRLLSESGRAPGAWQVVVRNLMRLVEFLPPFWVLGFLVLLSRNHQRLGDIFAQTVAVRRVAVRGDGDRAARRDRSTEGGARDEPRRDSGADRDSDGPSTGNS
ncbi:MAG: RDD family protein [Phycisphaerae bacterium]